MDDDDKYIVYMLINTHNKYTYIGSTNNPERRIRQHNGIICGGSKYTHLMKQNGEWIYYGFILGLDKHTALSVEKKIQKRTRKTYGQTPIEKRVNCINKLLLEYKYLSLTVL